MASACEQNRWTSKELRYLKKNRDTPIREQAAHLNRSESCVRVQRNRHGIRFTEDYWLGIRMDMTQAGQNKGEDETLCLSCRRAVSPGLGGCSWLKEYQPVPGWTAKPCHSIHWDGPSYEVRCCPNYVK